MCPSDASAGSAFHADHELVQEPAASTVSVPSSAAVRRRPAARPCRRWRSPSGLRPARRARTAPNPPGPDDRGCLGVGPRCVMMLVRRCGHAELNEDDPEGASAGAPERPEQVGVVVLVALQDATVGQHDRCRTEVIGGRPVGPAMIPSPPPKRRRRNPTGGHAGRNGEAVLLQCVVHIAEAGTGTDGRYTAGEVDGMHRARSTTTPAGSRRSGEAVPTAAKRGSRRCSARNETVSRTSSGVTHRTIASGRTSWKER